MNVSGKCNILSIYVHTQAQSFDKSLHEIRKGFCPSTSFYYIHANTHVYR